MKKLINFLSEWLLERIVSMSGVAALLLVVYLLASGLVLLQLLLKGSPGGSHLPLFVVAPAAAIFSVGTAAIVVTLLLAGVLYYGIALHEWAAQKLEEIRRKKEEQR